MIGHHIVKTAYGQWLPGDERGHWSAVWDQHLGQIARGGQQPGSAALERFARRRMRRPPATLSSRAIEIVRVTLAECEAASDWSIAAVAIEPTHLHLLITRVEGSIDATCKWIAQKTTRAVRQELGGDKPVWAKNKWCNHLFDEEHWWNTIAYINRRPGAVALPSPTPIAADGIRALETNAPKNADTVRGDQPAITIISGGQTGADRAALDFAIAHGFRHGGWCPRGRMAEDGPLDGRYRLRETGSTQYDERTRRNIDDSDATVVFSPAARTTGGTRLTLSHARRLGKPTLHLVEAANKPISAHAAALQGFLLTHRVQRLNVAGPRASQAPGIARFVRAVLEAALAAGERREPRPGQPGPAGVTTPLEPRRGRRRLDLHARDAAARNADRGAPQQR